MSGRTRSVALALLAIGISAAVFYQSLTWGIERTEIGPAAISPDGFYVAQFYTLPEDSKWAYGLGAYVSPRFIPPWLHSDLVFASYCRRSSLKWLTLRQLAVECQGWDAEPSPTLFPAPGGITVLPVLKLAQVGGKSPQLESTVHP